MGLFLVHLKMLCRLRRLHSVTWEFSL